MDASPSLERVAEIIATSPGWVRVGITAPDPRTRAAATDALAAFITAELSGPEAALDAAQLALAL